MREPVAHGHDQILRQWIWRDFANLFLGCWLIAGAFTLAEDEPLMKWNDIVCGGLICVLGILTLFPRFDLVHWGICFVGLWLLFAPLVLWTKSAGAYHNDVLVGSLVITFSVLIPTMPGRAHHELMLTPGPVAPPGWSYNPSDWIQRAPIIVMAFVGFFLSRYLAAYQLGHIAYPWDPFFGDGTRRVLDSEVSRAWPVSDAGLGAVSYMIEALLGFMGGRNRWRTMPWMVALFGVLVVPLGIVSILLVILQPVAVGAWCTLCLVTASAMLIMISPAFDEVVASCQFLARARHEGKSLWRTFWLGGNLESHAAAEVDTGAVERARSRSIPSRIVAAMDLNNVPWNLLLSAALGLWLMFSPAILGITGAAAHNHHLSGALVITCAVIAFSEIARPVRLFNILLGLWLVIAAWLFSGGTAAATWSDCAAGAALAALSVRRGAIHEKFGGWNRFLV